MTKRDRRRAILWLGPACLCGMAGYVSFLLIASGFERLESVAVAVALRAFPALLLSLLSPADVRKSSPALSWASVVCGLAGTVWCGMAAMAMWLNDGGPLRRLFEVFER